MGTFQVDFETRFLLVERNLNIFNSCTVVLLDQGDDMAVESACVYTGGVLQFARRDFVRSLQEMWLTALSGEAKVGVTKPQEFGVRTSWTRSCQLSGHVSVH